MQETTTLKTAYADKVAADLAENTAEQERIRAELEALQAQLAALESDHTLLKGVSAALGNTTTAMTAPRRGAQKKAAAAVKKSAAPVKKRAAKKTAKTTAAPVKKDTAANQTEAPATRAATARDGGAKTAKTGANNGVALAELVHTHLSAQAEPHTAREIAQALADAHPGRTINDNVVRTTTERLVARSRVERVKQGATVYYTAIKPAAPAASEPVEKAIAAAS
ncbi:hypothetical protein [Streptomyces sp. NPDC008141]|uniref:hypothetical protein n=1 Tax=Streptomyces sp. NPDC008141 TaxID=3364815 RepID=UPI0036EB2F46